MTGISASSIPSASYHGFAEGINVGMTRLFQALSILPSQFSTEVTNRLAADVYSDRL
jgi:hypothetical protein